MIAAFIARAVVMATICVDLVACGTQTHWEKEGTDQMALQQDLAACRISARDEVERNSYSTPTPIYRPIYRSSYLFAGARNYISQGDLTRFCMRNKGYELGSKPNKPWSSMSAFGLTPDIAHADQFVRDGPDSDLLALVCPAIS